MEYRLELSTRPENRVGADEVWDRAEATLAAVLDHRGLAYAINEGDGAFYGPKIDVHLTDSIGRSWQCGTFQLDFNLPERFELTYTGADDHEHRPVMIHRAMLGSFERFIGILIEHYAGEFPLWLAPTQAVVLPIADRHHPVAEQVVERLEQAGLRARADLRAESIGRKIAEAETHKVSVMLVVGDREADSGTVNVRRRGHGEVGSHDVGLVAEALRHEVEVRAERAPEQGLLLPSSG
jgi:threonyl-tRNA synthetase